MQGKIPESISLNQGTFVRRIFPVNDKRFFNHFSDDINFIREETDNPGAQNICQVIQTLIIVTVTCEFSYETVFLFYSMFDTEDHKTGTLHNLTEHIMYDITQSYKTCTVLSILVNNQAIF